MAKLSRIIISLFTLNVFTTACVTLTVNTPEPEDPQQRALYTDISELVNQNSGSWFLEDAALADLKNDSMRSICSVEQGVLDGTTDWLEKQVAGSNYTARQAFEKWGKRDKRTASAMILERSLLVVKQGQALRKDGKCPFWQKIQKPFYGIDSTYKRFYPMFETGGKAYAQANGDEARFLLGGTGRVLFGYGVRPDLDILIGGELGAATSVVDLFDGQALITLQGAVPIILRQQTGRMTFDAEAGPLFYVGAGEGTLRVGLRTGIGLGGPTLRLGPVSSRLALRFQYDFVPAVDKLPVVHQISVGITTAFTTKSLGYR